MKIDHHGARDGVTGSCHQLHVDGKTSFLIDCGLFQGSEIGNGNHHDRHTIDFDISSVKALIATHVHIDHVGRIPWLLAAGFEGPIICSQPSAKLLPLVLEDAFKLGISRDRKLVERYLQQIEQRLIALPYKQWFTLSDTPEHKVQIRLQRAGHILGSAYVEVDVGKREESSRTECAPTTECATTIVDATAKPCGSSLCERNSKGSEAPSTEKESGGSLRERISTRVVFSGDLGASDTPLLPAPDPPERADILVLESTYGDRNHENRATRKHRLKAAIDRALHNNGSILIPAFSIGRTQELLYELEELLGQHQWCESSHYEPENPSTSIEQAACGSSPCKRTGQHTELAASSCGSSLRERTNKTPKPSIPVILDSPLASKFTAAYRELQPFWDEEAHARLSQGRKPLVFDTLLTVDSHDEHLKMVHHLASSGRPAIVIAGSGMCNAGRIVNYLKAMLGDERHDVLFVGYQAEGTPGRDIQQYGPKGGWVELDGERYAIRAQVETIGGYSAHADQQGLFNFVKGMKHKPHEIRLVHGDKGAKLGLKEVLRRVCPKGAEFRA